ncbi:MAG TPA: CAP domain-containing protein [Candidatus Binatia bacterium]|nr:CAP domain-containing protein [Candidatus Binatia bacterium]
MWFTSRGRLGCGRPGSRNHGRRRGSAAVSFFLLAAVAASPAWASAGPPTNDEYALLVLTNESRAEPSADGGTEPVVPPLIWNDALAAAARAHSDDMATNGCFQHNSCGGGSWFTRVGSYYPNWDYLAENIGSGLLDPVTMHRGWMSSSGHRANLLDGSINEFGAGFAIGHDNFGTLPLATEDMGLRALVAQEMMPTLPAGAVLPRLGASGDSRDLIVNYYHYHGGAPQAVRAIVGSSCIPLALRNGSTTHGTYAAKRTLPGSGCVPLVFEAVRSDGRVVRWPSSGAILVGIGGSSCAERTTSAPTASCGAGGGPTPTPTPAPGPTPTPDPNSQDDLDKPQVMMRTIDQADGTGVIRLSALFDDAAFDPTITPIQVKLSFPGGVTWSETLPTMCSGTPCLRENATGAVFRARYSTRGPNLSFVRAKSGAWLVRYFSNTESIPDASDGPVALTITVEGVARSVTLEGRWSQGRYAAR